MTHAFIVLLLSRKISSLRRFCGDVIHVGRAFQFLEFVSNEFVPSRAITDVKNRRLESE